MSKWGKVFRDKGWGWNIEDEVSCKKIILQMKMKAQGPTTSTMHPHS